MPVWHLGFMIWDSYKWQTIWTWYLPPTVSNIQFTFKYSGRGTAKHDVAVALVVVCHKRLINQIITSLVQSLVVVDTLADYKFNLKEEMVRWYSSTFVKAYKQLPLLTGTTEANEIWGNFLLYTYLKTHTRTHAHTHTHTYIYIYYRQT